MPSKTLCLVSDRHDTAWLAPMLRGGGLPRGHVPFAPAFKGWLAARSLGLEPVTHEDLAWGLDNLALYDQARRAAHAWYELPGLADALQPVRAFRGYPLLAMHSSMLLLSFFEILQSLAFLSAVVERERPRRILAGARPNPFHKDMLHIVANSGGLEREAARAVAVSKGIEYVEMGTAETTAPAGAPTPPGGEAAFEPGWGPGNGPGILLFAWGGYYLEQLARTFPTLRDNDARVTLVLVGDTLTRREEERFEELGVRHFHKSRVHVPGMDDLYAQWNGLTREAFGRARSCPELGRLFRHAGVPWYDGLAEEAIRREMERGMAGTVVELARTEAILDALRPDLVFSHFAMHPGEACDVLPARKRGIPTLGMSHGVNGNLYAERDTFSSEHYGVHGGTYKDALARCFKGHGEKIHLLGESRLENLERTRDKRAAKVEAGFDPDKPLMIFCDTSGWTHSLAWRHSTRATVSQIVGLRDHFPDLQIIYRVHHGLEHAHLQGHIESLNDPGLVFQLSPNPLFTDIVQAADVVVSHVTSAITEALLMGVPVIHLRALSEPEPIYEGFEAIPIADDFGDIPAMIRAELTRERTPAQVRSAARPFFDAVLCGNDGGSTDRLARLMLKLAELPEGKRVRGFDDWLDRLRSSAVFTSSTLRSTARRGDTPRQAGAA